MRGRVRERAGASAVRMRPRAARFRDQPPTAAAVAQLRQSTSRDLVQLAAVYRALMAI
jgi:hypothetical protein